MKGLQSVLLPTLNLNFPFTTVNNLFKFSAQRTDLAPYIGNGTKVKIPFEIKPPLQVAHYLKIFFSFYFKLNLHWHLGVFEGLLTSVPQKNLPSAVFLRNRCYMLPFATLKYSHLSNKRGVHDHRF
jgi:hypothetical protein